MNKEQFRAMLDIAYSRAHEKGNKLIVRPALWSFLCDQNGGPKLRELPILPARKVNYPHTEDRMSNYDSFLIPLSDLSGDHLADCQVCNGTRVSVRKAWTYYRDYLARDGFANAIPEAKARNLATSVQQTTFDRVADLAGFPDIRDKVVFIMETDGIRVYRVG